MPNYSKLFHKLNIYFIVNTMDAANCIFGDHCPIHGRCGCDIAYCPIHGRCGCDIDWSSLQDTETVIDWLVSRCLSNPCIYIHENGQRTYYVFHNESFQEYSLCQFHFQSVWNLTELEILSILSSDDPRVRLAPEE